MLAHRAHAESSANSKPMSHAERMYGLSREEHRVCAREHKCLKVVSADGRCGWRMAAYILFGGFDLWANAKKLLIDAATSDYELFLELSVLAVEERTAYFKALSATNADSEQQFDLTMLQVLGWVVGVPIKVLSAVQAYDNGVYASEHALAMCNAQEVEVPEPICVVCACSLMRST